MTGVGGGSLMTPLLILLFGVHPVTAIGTDLLFAASTKTVGALVHGLSRTVEWPIVLRLAAGSVPATIVSLAALSALDLHNPAVQATITSALGCALLVTAGVLLFHKQIQRITFDWPGKTPLDESAWTTVTLGVFMGVLVTVTSLGAGAIGVTILVLIYRRLPMPRIVGSDIAHAVPLTLVAGTGHWLLGSVDWRLLSALLVGSIPGVAAGSYFSSRAADGVLRMLLAGILLVVALRMLI